ncbi:hypothetical protein TNCV_4655661 [Trichonephila clavipes]|nr:hypothetical protein TNCV_4655661 [Trichonephila clavipes]
MCTLPVGQQSKEAPVELIRRQPQKSGSDIPEPTPNLSVDSLYRMAPVPYHLSPVAGTSPRAPFRQRKLNTPTARPLLFFTDEESPMKKG